MSHASRRRTAWHAGERVILEHAVVAFTKSSREGRSQVPMKTVRIIEIAELLGVNKQRAQQIAGEDEFPAPVAEHVRRRLWDRREVAAWAGRVARREAVALAVVRVDWRRCR
jgi:predicted DNA-binding transcriptional regulator AlpA